MKLRIIILSLLIIHSLIILSQDTWIQYYQPFNTTGFAPDYSPKYLVICQDGGFAVNGYYHDEETWNDTAFLMKTDSTGNFQWAYHEQNVGFFDHQSKCFVETDDEGFLMAVTSMWGGTALVKIDAYGNREWDVDGQGFYTKSMDKTIDGNIILGGRMNGLPAIKKTTQDAEIIWEYTYYLSGSGDGSIQSITKTTDCGYIATGYTSGNGYDAFVLKVDSVGDSVWYQTFDGYGNWDEGNCIIENSLNNIFVVGRAANPWNGPLLWMLDHQGETIWVEYENAYVGYEQWSAVCLPDNSLLVDSSSLYCIDTDNNLLWESETNPSGRDKNIQILNEEYLLFPGGIYISNEDYITISKTDLQGYITSSDENEIQEINLTFFNCYPNPFYQNSNFLFNSKKDEQISLKIYNIKGELIRSLISEKNHSYGLHKIIWDGKDVSGKSVCSEIYCCRLIGNKGIYSIKKITKIN